MRTVWVESLPLPEGKVGTDIENLYEGGHCEQVGHRNVNNDNNDSQVNAMRERRVG